MANRRTRRAIQTEVCDLCGRVCDQSKMFVSDVEGLRGRLICPYHRWGTGAARKPSYADYRRDGGDALPFDGVAREEPIGGELTLYEVSED